MCQVPRPCCGVAQASRSACVRPCRRRCWASWASLASFAVGLISLAIVVAFVDRTYSLGDALKKGNPWWMWVGGLLGATLVMCNAYLSAHIGTGMTVMLVLLGQVGGGLLVDRFGLLGVPRKPVAGIQYVGVLVAIVGIVLKAM